MTKENKDIIVHRLKSLAWRAGMMAAVAGVDFVATNMQLFDLPPVAITLIGLAAGEISKYLNSNMPRSEDAI